MATVPSLTPKKPQDQWGAGWGQTAQTAAAQPSGSTVPASQFGQAPKPYQAFTKSFAAPTGPTDLGNAWGQTFQFNGADLANDPVHQFEQAEARKQMERSAAARGTLLTGGTAKALQDRAQAIAASHGQQAFDRALSTYRTNFDVDTTDKSRRAGEAQRGFDNARATYLDEAGIHNQNEVGRFDTERTARLDDRGIFEDDRNFDANRDDTYWTRGREEVRDSWQRDDNLWTRARTERLDDHGLDQDFWNRGRAETLDSRDWDRELWGRDYRTDRDLTEDLFRWTDYGFNAAMA